MDEIELFQLARNYRELFIKEKKIKQERLTMRKKILDQMRVQKLKKNGNSTVSINVAYRDKVDVARFMKERPELGKMVKKELITKFSIDKSDLKNLEKYNPDVFWEYTVRNEILTIK